MRFTCYAFSRFIHSRYKATSHPNTNITSKTNWHCQILKKKLTYKITMQYMHGDRRVRRIRERRRRQCGVCCTQLHFWCSCALQGCCTARSARVRARVRACHVLNHQRASRAVRPGHVAAVCKKIVNFSGWFVVWMCCLVYKDCLSFFSNKNITKFTMYIGNSVVKY